MVYNEKYFHTSSSTISSGIKPDVWHIDGTKLLENHPRFKGMRAAIDYLNIKRDKQSKKCIIKNIFGGIAFMISLFVCLVMWLFVF